MDVRFSIIENDLEWEEQQQNEDEKTEISSEDSGGGVPTDSIHPQNTHKFKQEIWTANDIEKSLRKYENFELFFDMIKLNKITKVKYSIQDINLMLLIASWLGKEFLVSQLLDNYRAEPSTSDYEGRTSLHLACLLPNLTITRMLIRHGAEVHVWDKSRYVTPLHCAASAGSVECIHLLLRNGAQLNAGIEKKSALHFAVENNAISCVYTLLNYGAVPNTPQVFTETPLHIAAALGHKECIKVLVEHGADVRSQFGKRRLTALHLAVEEDYIDCVKILLELDAEIDSKNVDQQTPLHLACLAQSSETVDLLLNKGANARAIYKDGRTALHAAIVKESKDWECAKLLLIAGVDVNRADNYGYTPLHLAALNEFGSCAYLLIEHGADLTARTNGGISALAFIVRRTPEIIPKYIAKFDSSIKVNDHEIGDVDCEIKLDFRLLVPNTDRGETELLLAFIEIGQKRVLKHPLCETFLFLKWRRIRKFFLFSLFFHSFFVLIFTLFILGVYVVDCTEPTKFNEKCVSSYYMKFLGYLAVLINFVMLGKELFQMAHGFVSYVKNWENWLQWTIIFGVFSCALPEALMTEDLTSIPAWQHHVAGVVIFMVWLELMMLVGRFPIFGLYVQMFTKVAVNFSKFLMAYCCLLIAFGLSFAVLFSNYDPFKSVPHAFLKTIVMMAGELEFEDIFHGETEIKYPLTVHVIFLSFVLLVTVILTNLLVGLAVSDIQGLQDSAGLDRLSRQAELVSRLEGLFYSTILKKGPQKFIKLCQRSALLRTSRCHLQFCIKPNDPREKRLPKDLIYSIYKLVAERRDRNQSIRRRKRKINYSFFKRTIDKEPDGIKLRRISTDYLRNRTFSDNAQQIKNGQPINYQEFSWRKRYNRRAACSVTDIICKIENYKKIITENLDDMTKELEVLKNRLNK